MVFVPGGDPGHTRPKLLMPFRKGHSRVAPASSESSGEVFAGRTRRRGLEELLQHSANQTRMADRQAVHGPWVRVTPEQLRAAVLAQYPIRLYPDISHTMRCQYPMRDWDRAYALTYVQNQSLPGRAPKPEIFHALRAIERWFRHVLGRLQRRRKQDHLDSARLGSERRRGRRFARVRALPRWRRDSLAAVSRWSVTGKAARGQRGRREFNLLQFQSMERSATPATLLNWRFQQGLYRAMKDIAPAPGSSTKAHSKNGPWNSFAMPVKWARPRLSRRQRAR